jgi:hypothetical protein
VAVSDRENLRVPKATAICLPAFIGDEYAITVHHKVDELEPLNQFAVGPATLEVRLTVEPIIERAREVR